MRRTNLYLDERQTSALDRRAKAAGVSRAELVRRLIDRSLSAEEDSVDADLAAIDGSFGALRDDAEFASWQGGLRPGTDARAAYLDSVRSL